MFQRVCVPSDAFVRPRLRKLARNQFDLWMEIKWYEERRRQVPQQMCLLSRQRPVVRESVSCTSPGKAVFVFYTVFSLVAKVLSLQPVNAVNDVLPTRRLFLCLGIAKAEVA